MRKARTEDSRTDLLALRAVSSEDWRARAHEARTDLDRQGVSNRGLEHTTAGMYAISHKKRLCDITKP